MERRPVWMKCANRALILAGEERNVMRKMMSVNNRPYHALLV
jgi:hypothetical protein